MLLQRAFARPIALVAIGVALGAAIGCPTPPPEGQSDPCAVMMRCWYAENAFIENPEQIPVRLQDGDVLTENDIQLIRDHYGENGACWQDEILASKCTDACVEALSANCDDPLTQCLNSSGSAFESTVAVGTVTSCDDVVAPEGDGTGSAP